MHTIWKGSPCGGETWGAGLLGLTKNKEVQRNPCNLSDFCFLSGLLHTKPHFLSATWTSAGEQSEIMLNANLINNSVTVRSEIARARAAFTGICSQLSSNTSLLTGITKGTSAENGCGRWKAFLIRRRRSKAVANGVLFRSRGKNRWANKKRDLRCLHSRRSCCTSASKPNSTEMSFLFELKILKMKFSPPGLQQMGLIVHAIFRTARNYIFLIWKPRNELSRPRDFILKTNLMAKRRINYRASRLLLLKLQFVWLMRSPRRFNCTARKENSSIVSVARRKKRTGKDLFDNYNEFSSEPKQRGQRSFSVRNAFN